MAKRESPAGPDYALERALAAHGPVCGVDEAGRGPWAGPVVAAAVILDEVALPAGINDSKKLTAERREALALEIRAHAHVGVGLADVDEIDRLNIREATFVAMARAVAALPVRPAHALIDGRDAPEVGCPARAVIKGDGLSLSIGAASIIAKTVRDTMMTELGAAHPGYGFERHMGYGTAAHKAALERLGPCVHHRKSFAPIRNMLSPDHREGLDIVLVNEG